MSIELITLLLFLCVIVLLALGLPLVFTLGGTAMLFTALFWGPKSLYMVAPIIYRGISSEILLAVPMFLFMGAVLQYSGIAHALYEAMYRWLGGVKGGLAMGTVLICTIFAAMAGISGVATVTMGLIALPAMFDHNYSKGIALGSVAGGGALGILIPPSVTMILYAFLAGESVGKLFMGGVFPGLLLSGLFLIYISIRCALQPHLGPSVSVAERATWREKIVSLRAMILPGLLVILVLGSIYAGICTPTEASGVGALGALVCGVVYRGLTWTTLKEACYRATRLSAMVMWIVVSAACFSTIFIAIGAQTFVSSLLVGLPIGRWGILIVIQLSLFIFGMFLDPAGIIMICTPIFVPIVMDLGFDSLWFGILFILNMQMAYLTPPFGFNLFYLKGVVPKGVTMGDIYRSVFPFVGIQAVALIIVMVVPQIAIWLPGQMIK